MGKAIFKLSYKELRRHVLKLDLWRVSHFTFNSYVGVGKQLSLWDIANRDAMQRIRIQKKQTPDEEEKMRKTGGKKARAPDVAIFESIITFEEEFEFRLSCENWTLEMEEEHPDFKRKWK